LLDSYEAERRPVAAECENHPRALEMMSLSLCPGRAAGWCRN